MNAKSAENRHSTSKTARRVAPNRARAGGRLQPKNDGWADARRVLRAASANAAASALIQSRLSVGRPGDPYEREADRAADQYAAGHAITPITSLPAGGLKTALARQAEEEESAQPLQRQAEKEKKEQAQPLQRQEEGEEEQTQALRLKREEEQEPVAQRQPEPEKEPAQALQRQPEEEEDIQTRGREEEDPPTAQRQPGGDEEEETVQSLRRQPEDEEGGPAQRQADEEEEAVQPLAQPGQEKEPEETVQQAAEKEEEKVQGLQTPGGGTGTSAGLGAQLAASSAGGAPLPAGARTRMENQFGTDFSGVRIHTGATAVQMNRQLHAQAFTHGSDIYFGAGRYNPETGPGQRLLAHELTHVVQQGSAPQTATAQKRPAGNTVQRGNGEGGRGLLGRIWDATGGRLLQAGADLVWGFLRERAPQLVPLIQSIRRQGIIGFLRERIGGAFTRIFNRLRADNAVVARLFQVFNLILAQAAIILNGLRAGSCRPLFAAIETMKQAITRAASDAWNAITDFFRPVGDFFADVWRRFGAPVVDWIRDVAGDVWDWITGLGRSVWGWMAPVREAFSDAWEWLKRQLGIGQDEGNDQGGLMNWIREKAGQAWQAIRETLAPVIAPIQGVVSRIREILPLEAIGNLRQTVTGWLSSVTNMTQRLEREDGVAQQQTSLREEILPGVLRTIRRLRTGISNTGRWIAGRIGSLADTIQGFFGGLNRHSLLRPVTALLRWVPQQVGRLSQWAGSTVRRLFDLFGDGLVYLSRFIEPVLGTLQKVVEVLGDLAGKLSELIFGRFWRMIPRCIRDPIKDFIVQRILSNIPIFGQLLQIPNIWARVQATAMRILRQVFVTGDLPGAAWTFFREVLNLINIPARLVLGIVRKAATALGDILTNPIGFLLNLVRGMVRGVVQFCSNIGRHIIGGISGWLFGQLQEAGIQPPADFSLRSILGFVLQVLDITRERIFRRMERHPRIGPERVARLRSITERLSGLWEWVSVLINEGPAGLWRMLRERLSNLWQTVLNSIITWISTRVISRALARLATMADPSGIGAVINIIVTIYQAIQTAAQYARQILEAVDRYLDGIASVARGALGPAANFLERALARLLPAAIGFVANWVGLGGLGRRIREMVERIRAQVDRAIDWLIQRGVRTIDAILRGVRALGGAIREGASRLSQWWLGRKRFTVEPGDAHQLWIERRGSRSVVMMASNSPGPAKDKLRSVKQSSDDTEVIQNANSAEADIDRLETSATQAMAAGSQRAAAAAGGSSESLYDSSPLKIADTLRAHKSHKRFSEFYRNSPFRPQSGVSRFYPQGQPDHLIDRSSQAPYTVGEVVSFFQNNAELRFGNAGQATNMFRRAWMNRRLHSRVGQDGRKWAIMEPQSNYAPVIVDKLDEGADSDLRTVVDGLGIEQFIVQMGTAGQASHGGITLGGGQLNNLLTSYENRSFLADRIRGLNRGHHEWLPSGMVGDVINRITNAPDSQKVALAGRLTKMYRELRTETKWVIFKPNAYKTPSEETPGTFNINGHPGALYRRAFRSGPASAFEGAFHSELETKFSPDKTIPEVIGGFRTVFRKYVWNGRSNFPAGLKHNLNPTLNHSEFGVLSDQTNLQNLETRQQSEYDEADGKLS